MKADTTRSTQFIDPSTHVNHGVEPPADAAPTQTQTPGLLDQIISGAQRLGEGLAHFVDTRTAEHRDAVKAWRARAQTVGGADSVADVDASRLKSIAEELAPLVALDTGMKLDLSGVSFQVVSRSELFERFEADNKKRAPAEEPQGLWERIKSGIFKLGTKAMLGATFIPTDSSLLVPKDLLKSANADGLRRELYEALVQVAQRQQYPSFFDGIDDLSRQALAAEKEHGRTSEPFLDLSDTIAARSAWASGHANHIVTTGSEERFPEAKVGLGMRLLGEAGGLLHLLTRPGRDKVAQWITGPIAFARVAEARPEHVERFYTQPKLADLLLKSRGRVELQVRHDLEADQFAALKTKLRDILGINPRGTQPELVLSRAPAPPPTWGEIRQRFDDAFKKKDQPVIDAYRTLHAIITGDGRAKRRWANALYGDLKRVLTGEAGGSPLVAKTISALDEKAQRQFWIDAFTVIGAVNGFESHATRLRELYDAKAAA